MALTTDISEEEIRQLLGEQPKLRALLLKVLAELIALDARIL